MWKTNAKYAQVEADFIYSWLILILNAVKGTAAAASVLQKYISLPPERGFRLSKSAL